VIGSVSTIFESHFSRFRRFCDLRRRYTHVMNPTLMYCPVQTELQAPQMGPGGTRFLQFCPWCGFGLKPFVLLGPIDLGGRGEYCEYWLWVGSKSAVLTPVANRLHSSYSKSPDSSELGYETVVADPPPTRLAAC
jgi:hypothetical protein